MRLLENEQSDSFLESQPTACSLILSIYSPPIPSYNKKFYVFLKCFGKCEGLNPFVLIVTFEKPQENIKKPLCFLIFSGGIEMLHWEQIV